MPNKAIKIIGSFVLVFALYFASTSLAHAQASTPEERTAEIAGSVMSPFCPGRSLNDCPSGDASTLKHQITKMLTEGKTEDEVYASLFKQYGEQIRAVPPTRGFGWFAWLTPFIFVALGVSVLSAWLRRSSGGENESTQSKPLDSNVQHEIDRLVRESD